MREFIMAAKEAGWDVKEFGTGRVELSHGSYRCMFMANPRAAAKRAGRLAAQLDPKGYAIGKAMNGGGAATFDAAMAEGEEIRDLYGRLAKRLGIAAAPEDGGGRVKQNAADAKAKPTPLPNQTAGEAVGPTEAESEAAAKEGTVTDAQKETAPEAQTQRPAMPHMGGLASICSATESKGEARDGWRLVTFLAEAEDADGQRRSFVFPMRFAPDLNTPEKMTEAVRLAAEDAFGTRDVPWKGALLGIGRDAALRHGYEPVPAIGPIRVAWDESIGRASGAAHEAQGKPQARKGLLGRLFMRRKK